EKDLKEAFENKEFELHYQPQVCTGNKTVTGFEALLRWNSPKYGQVSPSVFIPVAEETGLINDIGKLVIDYSFAFAKSLQGQGLCVSCNVSPVQLIQSDFVDAVIGMYDKYGLKKGEVAIEITENILVESFEDTNDKLRRLREKGILIYLDDFGTGYSSLTYLKNLPIDIVKIDKLFIDDITIEGSEKSLVKSILSLAHDIGLKVVAEGVENEYQRECLAQCECDFVQGYLIGKPVPERLALMYLRSV
ncbi:MAG: putative bifunctional diguanylate cyclase/phosphodiesterase, partial [Pseudomonadota bacterium]